MRRRLPPLNSLRLFEAAARTLSFKNGAQELLLTPSAVSHGIQALEEWFGTPLFARTARGLVLTEAGRDFYPCVAEALDLLTSGSERIMTRSGQGVLAVSAAPAFAARWLLPRLQSFRRLHPGIRVVIDTSHEKADFSDIGPDVAIRLGLGAWSGVFSELVLREELVPVCAPALAAGLPGENRIDDNKLIHVVNTSVDWVFWAKNMGYPEPDPKVGLAVDSITMAFEAACQGLGVALGRKPLVDPELASGRLVEIWAKPMVSEAGYWFVCAEDLIGDVRIGAFRNWIRAEAQGDARDKKRHGQPPVK